MTLRTSAFGGRALSRRIVSHPPPGRAAAEGLRVSPYRREHGGGWAILRAMSQENVEIVRAAIEAFDGGHLGLVLATLHPDFEGRVAPELSAEPDTYRGREGIERYFASFREAFEGIGFEVEQLADAGDSVVVALRMTAVGKLTGIPVEQRNAGVWTVLEGKVARVDTYASFSDALRAAGLER